MSPIERLLACAGRWEGTNRLTVSPDQPGEDSPSTLTIAPVHGGRFVHIDQTWSEHSKSQEGSLLIGCESDAGPMTIHWIDTWHMSRKVMSLRGPLREDGAIDVIWARMPRRRDRIGAGESSSARLRPITSS